MASIDDSMPRVKKSQSLDKFLHRLHPLIPEEIRDRAQRDPDRDQRYDVGNEIRINSQADSADERCGRPLFLAVDEEADADGTEEQAPQERRLAHAAKLIGAGRRALT